jgi:hypothetical protein
MIETILDALVDILQEKLIDDITISDTARPQAIKVGSLQDDPTRVTPSILVKHHPDLGSVPGWVPGHEIKMLEEIGGHQHWTHNFLISAKVYASTKDDMLNIRRILTGRIQKAVSENYTLASTMDAETNETITGGESHVITNVKSKISGGDSDWFGDIDISVHYHTTLGDYDNE